MPEIFEADLSLHLTKTWTDGSVVEEINRVAPSAIEEVPKTGFFFEDMTSAARLADILHAGLSFGVADFFFIFE